VNLVTQTNIKTETTDVLGQESGAFHQILSDATRKRPSDTHHVKSRSDGHELMQSVMDDTFVSTPRAHSVGQSVKDESAKYITSLTSNSFVSFKRDISTRAPSAAKFLLKKEAAIVKTQPELEADLRAIGLYPAPAEAKFYDVILAAVIAAIHCLIPGIFRYISCRCFGGEHTEETVITALNIVICFPCVFFGCLYLREIAALYAAQGKALQRLAFFTKPADALKANLPCYLDILEGNNLDAWLLIRRDILSDYASNPKKSKIVSLFLPALLLDLALTITIFVRVLIQKKEFDIFNVLSVFDMFVLDVFLLSIILFVVKCNSLSQSVHIQVLERERYRVAKLITIAKSGHFVEGHLIRVSTLIDSAISKVEKLADQVTLMGFAVDEALFAKFVGVMATGAAAGLAKIITAPRDG